MIAIKRLPAILVSLLLVMPAQLLACDLVKENIDSAERFFGKIADADWSALRFVSDCNTSWELCSLFDNAAYRAAHHLTNALTSMIETDDKGRKCIRCSRALLNRVMDLTRTVDVVNATLNQKNMDRGWQYMPYNWEYLAKLPNCRRTVLPPPIVVEPVVPDDRPFRRPPSNPQGPNWDAGCTSRQFRKGGATHRYSLWGDPIYGDLWLICSDRDDALWIKHNTAGSWQRVTRRISHGARQKNDANCYTEPEITTSKKTYRGKSLCIVNP